MGLILLALIARVNLAAMPGKLWRTECIDLDIASSLSTGGQNALPLILRLVLLLVASKFPPP